MNQMKNLWRTFLCATVLSLGLASCDPIPEEDPSGGNQTLEITIGEPTATSSSATVKMNIAEGVTDYAYTRYTSDNLPSSKPTAMRLFRSSDNIIACEAGEQDITFRNLNQNTTYHFYLAFRCGTKLYDKVFEFEVTTSKIEDQYKVEEKNLDGFKIYMKLPDAVRSRGNVIRYTSGDIVTYNENRMNGFSDESLLALNGSRWFGEVGSSDPMHNSDELNYVMNHNNCYERDENGDMIYDEDGNPLLVASQIVPGEPIVFLAGEYSNVTALGLPWQGALYNHESQEWHGYFKRDKFRVQMPEPLNANITITTPTLEEVGAISATLIIEPEDKVSEFCIYVIDKSQYENNLLKYLEGDEDLMQWFTTSAYAFNIGSRVVRRPESGTWDEPVRIVVDEGINMTANTTYNVYVVGVGDPSLSHQSFFKTQFSTRPKKLETPKVVVTPIDNPDGVDPFEVWYNVKCTTNNAVSGRYACNDTDTWVKMLNSGMGYTNAAILNNAGGVFTEEHIEQINSPEGLNMNFPAYQGTTMRLAVAVFNAENDANNINSPTTDENDAIADQTTTYAVAAERVEHEYLDTEILTGEWTLAANTGAFVGIKVPDENGDYEDEDGNRFSVVQEWQEKVRESKVVIMREVPCPDEISQEVYDAYPNMTPEKIEELFASFKHAVNVYNESLRAANRLILFGFNDQGAEDMIQSKPMMPYELFLDREYNGFDVYSILRDWGPKWFIEFAKDENGQIVMTVPFNSSSDQPMTQCGPYPLYMAAINHSNTPDATTGQYKAAYRHVGTGNITLKFPVSVSASADRITFDPLYVDGVVANDGSRLPMYPNRVYYDMTTSLYSMMYPVYMESPVLTKGWTEQAPEASQLSAPSAAAAMTLLNVPLYNFAPKGRVRSAWNITPFINVKPEAAPAREEVKYRDVVYKVVSDPAVIKEKIHEVSVRKYNLEK